MRHWPDPGISLLWPRYRVKMNLLFGFLSGAFRIESTYLLSRMCIRLSLSLTLSDGISPVVASNWTVYSSLNCFLGDLLSSLYSALLSCLKSGLNVGSKGMTRARFDIANLTSSVSPGFPDRCKLVILFDLLKATPNSRSISGVSPQDERFKCTRFEFIFMNLHILRIAVSELLGGSIGIWFSGLSVRFFATRASIYFFLLRAWAAVQSYLLNYILSASMLKDRSSH